MPRVQGLRRNPPVTIEDWPDADDDSVASDDNDDGALPIDGEDQDLEYVERDAPLGLDALDEPALDDEALRAILDAELGDLADEEWVEMCKFFIHFYSLYRSQLRFRQPIYNRSRPNDAPIPSLTPPHTLFPAYVRRPPPRRLQTTQYAKRGCGLAPTPDPLTLGDTRIRLLRGVLLLLSGKIPGLE